MIIRSVGWAIVHSIWQAAAVAALLTVALALTRRAAPTVRYALSLAALVTTLVLPVVTAVVHEPPAVRLALTFLSTSIDNADAGASDGRDTMGMAATGVVDDDAAPIGSPHPLHHVRLRLDDAMPGIVALWTVGLLVAALRFGRGVYGLRLLVERHTRPAPQGLVAVTARLARRIGIRTAVRVRVSAAVHAPIVFGFARPLILLPFALASGLTPAQVESLIAHELAHVRRLDLLVNLLQRAAEALLFYHPAVWWISERMREEREACCDDLAVRACGDAASYASALLAVEEMRDLRLSTVLAASNGSLLRRVQRLAQGESGRIELGAGWATGLVGFVALLLVSGSTARGERGDAGEAIPARVAAASEPLPLNRRPDDTAPATVIPTVTFRERWDRAERDVGESSYWVGYIVHAAQADFDVAAPGENGASRERRRKDPQAYAARAALLQLTGPMGAGDLAVFLRFETSPDGSRLARLHATRGQPAAGVDPDDVVWLGDARSRESIARLRAEFETMEPRQRRELVAAIGRHPPSRAVVDALAALLGSGLANDHVREEAVRWLARHPTADAVAVLCATARSEEHDEDVREEALESLGRIAVDAAADSLIVLSRTLDRADLRAEAIAAIGERTDSRATPFLTTIAWSGQERSSQLEAIEALGNIADARALQSLRELARHHPHASARSKAGKQFARAAGWEDAVPVLRLQINSDPERDVRLDAVRSLRRLRVREVAVATLSELARGHESSEIRTASVRELGELRRDREATAVLSELSESGDPAVSEKARELLRRAR